MRNAGLNRGRSAVGLFSLSALLTCTGTALGADTACGGLEAKQVGHALAGEWEGQIQVHADDGKLSAAPASMSARLSDDRESLEVYYEGFAFGQPIEGAMVLSFALDEPEARMKDQAIELSATCTPDAHARPQEQRFQLTSPHQSLGQFRVVFERVSQQSWNIVYQSRPGGQAEEWEDMLCLQLDKLDAGQRSAAADSMDHSLLLGNLLADSAVASVETDD